MAHIQVEASVRTHKKFLKAGPAASWLWLCGVGYCQDGLTDGFIPFEALPYLGVKAPKNLKTKLVDVGLWDEVPGGWKIHDYEAHNRTAAQIRDMKDRRGRGGYLGGRPARETLEETLKVSLDPNHARNPSQIISDHLSTDTKQEEVDSSPVVLTFPVAGGVKAWTLTQGQIEAWVQSFPGLDVEAECRKALAWVEASPAKKTANGMPRFLVNWLSRATNNTRPATTSKRPSWAV